MSIMVTNEELLALPFDVAHPTEIVKEEIKARGISQKELAYRMGMKPSNLSRFLKGENITPAIAVKLEVALEIPAELWLKMQAQYEIDSRKIAQRNEKEKASINTERMLSNIINLQEVYKRLKINSSFFIQKKLSILEDLFGFSLLEIGSYPFAQQCNFKKNEKNAVDEKNETTWLALSYIEARKNRPNEVFQIEKANIAAKQIVGLTHSGKITEALIKEILHNNGIAYCVVPKMERTPIDAASMMLEDYPAIITTHRYNDMNRLVFNVLHELGHIFLHTKQKKGAVFVSSEHSYSRENKEEKEANEFAENMLIPKDIWSKMMSANASSLSKQSVLKRLKQLSAEYSLNFDIVVWRYKHDFNQYGFYGIKSKIIC